MRQVRKYARPAAAVTVLFLLLVWLGRVQAERRAAFATRATIATVLRAVEAYRADHEGHCPGGPEVLVSPPEGATPYLRSVPIDAWGRPLRIRCPGRKNPETADVSSAGPTGSFNDPTQIE